MDQSSPQSGRFDGRLTTGHHSGVAHITGMVAPLPGGIRQGNETMETNDGDEMTAIFTFFLTQVGHLGHHVLTPAAGSSLPGPLVTGMGGPLPGGIGGPLHRNTQSFVKDKKIS